MAQARFWGPVLPLAGAAALCTLAAGGAYAERPPGVGHVEIPESSIEQPDDNGKIAHTNIKLFVLEGAQQLNSPKAAPQASGPPYSGYFYETPASLGCVYQLVPPVAPGCNPNSVTANPQGGTRAIAIVDAYHYRTAMSDLGVFSAQFGLPAPTAANFQVVFANGRQPPVNANWNIEEALDIEWAHAMAPNAKIYLVEAASSSFADLLTAVSVANSLVSRGGEVSMSWGGSEFSSETGYDRYFTQLGVVYFASSGDSPGVIWPATSPNVVSVGGTSISRDPISGNFIQEGTWQSGGGGPSLYEARPSYQNAISAKVGTKRGTPDVAAVANPSTGVWVYASPYWYIVGGTSVASPVWAGIVNAAGHFSASTASELTPVYPNLANSNPSNASYFNDIVAGTCGPNQGYLAGLGWDFCTGVGSPAGTGGK